MSGYRVSVEQLTKIAIRLFIGMGYSEKDATLAADVLVETDRRGVDTHGLARMGLYNKLTGAEGRVNKNARLRIISETPPYLMIDADHGLGVIMAPQAVELAISRAAEHGACIMGVRNSGHFGAAGYYADKCVRKGFIALVSSNSPATMAPYGGIKEFHGNSPWSLAIPGGNRYPEPVMFDMACSEVSNGKIETAIRENRQVPIGWGIDKNGEPATDPAAIWQGGCLLPFGGVKGYCIALLLEMLSSMLTFASFGNSTNMGGNHENTSHFVLLMDPDKFGSPELYRESVDVYIDQIKAMPLASGVSEIIVPGELEARAITANKINGIYLDKEVADSLAEVARERRLLPAGQGFEKMLDW